MIGAEPLPFSITLEPQEGETYQDVLAVARRVEALGFAGLYRSDHYAPVWGGEGLASTDAWATLAGLARDTERITIGTMVSPVTFRPAANLAKVTATVAQMAGAVDGRSRVHVGLGTGWLQAEHTMFGFPFDDLGTRFRRLEEHLQVLRGLWDPQIPRFRFDGEFEQLRDAVFAAKPDPVPRIVLGGSGPRRSAGLAARYADEMNTPFPTPASFRALRAALDEACAAAGREPIPLTVTAVCVLGADEAEFRRRAERLHARIGDRPLDEWLAQRSGTWVLGTPDRALEHLTGLVEAGAAGFSLQHLLPDDLDMLDLLAESVAARLGDIRPAATAPDRAV
ncbi:LLM class flavin-dependent oxidoreductase [Pseudonocardia sp. MH-G8]|uniref:LLM class flavin-dependent oxidoreductase n=1 Tax=Pseudonocardia sp. MH-G8 TaxID=1854588 RepID=UPI000BA0B55D|nr:LLM class flavin-dependent oxidoreductase [Pseudonocardia sp. MH-G8]OZM77943.1 LLM class F420-dependent oxidoreductase [Pseudonocardia sp. MH-G8]